MTPPSDPSRSTAREGVRAEYARRLEARRRTLMRQVGRERRIADARLLVFVAGLVLAWFSLFAERVAPGWLAVPLGWFVLLVVVHEYARRASHRAARATVFYEKGLARLEDRWAGTGEPGSRFLDPDHPYAADLDLFGVGSLFERLCTARTRAGEETLAAWLLRPAAPEAIAERHAALAELRHRLDLREDLELLGSDVRAGIDPAALAAWGATPRILGGRARPLMATVLAALALASLVGWLASVTSLSLFFLVLVGEIVFAWRVSGRVRRVLADVEQRTHDLVLLAALLTRLEREPFRAAALRRLRAALETGGQPASRRIARLARLLHLLNTQKNQLFLPLAAILLWTMQLAFAIDAWRGRSGPAIAGWLEAVGEFEALCALAAYADENPDDPFPEVVAEGTFLDAEGIGHPLIAVKDCVRNDLSLGDGARRVFVVSGSNMSGKSTLLRSVGINAVLALAGAPVRARRLRLTPLMVGATLRIQDSLQAGRSRFYAEITRVRQLMDLARGSPPLLFLLDELFHGTNSHDRSVGAGAIVRGLIERGSIGLVTTHDLALAAIVDQLAPRAENVHFEDRLVNGVMHFDYRMRPGIVQHSNALALMRSVGLEV
ncbi:MAG TPA: DNA mismatch repair protein MutS [Isosphaeraceae bacterium]|nr:DNA mismatch repair protein MutS [Isosphaeraceae bacterium]